MQNDGILKRYLIRKLLLSESGKETARGLSIVTLDCTEAPSPAILAGRKRLHAASASFEPFCCETAGVEQLDGAIRITPCENGDGFNIDFIPAKTL